MRSVHPINLSSDPIRTTKFSKRKRGKGLILLPTIQGTRQALVSVQKKRAGCDGIFPPLLYYYLVLHIPMCLHTTSSPRYTIPLALFLSPSAPEHTSLRVYVSARTLYAMVHFIHSFILPSQPQDATKLLTSLSPPPPPPPSTVPVPVPLGPDTHGLRMYVSALHGPLTPWFTHPFIYFSEPATGRL